MSQPIGNCPGCGDDQPFEQIHPQQCPDVDGDCPEWACVTCGAAVIMGTVTVGRITVDETADQAARHSVRAA